MVSNVATAHPTSAEFRGIVIKIKWNKCIKQFRNTRVRKMMGYGIYGGSGMGGFGLGFIAPLINIIILFAIIWAVSSIFNNRHDCGDNNSRIARLERETEHTKNTLKKIHRKFE